MNLKSFIMSTALSVVIAGPAFAARADMVTVIPKSKNFLLEGSSEHNRVGQDYMLTGQLVGFTVSPVPSVGVAFGRYLDRNNILQFEYTKGNLPYIFFNLAATTVGGNYKHFYGNSFYTKVGLDYREISVGNLDLFYYRDLSTIGEASALTANLAIGNQWQWENFTLGCDWLGINPTLAVLQKKYKRSGSLDEEDQKSLDDSWNKIASVTSVQLLRFYLGASF